MTQRADGTKIPRAHVPPDYARLLAQGWDTIQEAYAFKYRPGFVETLEETQKKARDLRADLTGSVPLELGGELFQAQATGSKGGFRWRLENDDMIVMLRSPRTDYTISIRYLSAGLWEHGLNALRVRAQRALGTVAKSIGNDNVRTSRADWCFDFYSPSFTEEFRQSLARNVVTFSSVKKREYFKPDFISEWSCGVKGETLTIGSKSGLQVELYNKAKEITDISGKTWMYDVWLSALDGEWIWDDADAPGGIGKVRDVYRLELRYGKEFLKDRNVNRPGSVDHFLPELVNEALHNRRLTIGGADTANRNRWPMHPLWCIAADEFNSRGLLPIGRQVTGKRDELSARALQHLAGLARSSTVLKHGVYLSSRARELMNEAFDTIERDPEHLKKEQGAVARYATVDEAS